MLSPMERRILQLWLDELGLEEFIEVLIGECRDRAEFLSEDLPISERRELDELEKQCEPQPFRFFRSKPQLPSSPKGRMTEMWRNAIRGLSNLSRSYVGARQFKLSLVGLPSKDCYDGGLSKPVRKIIRRELSAAARIVELVVLPETSFAEGRDGSAFTDSIGVREAYARLKEAMAAYDAARGAA